MQRQSFNDERMLMRIDGDSLFPLRHAIDDEEPDVYELATKTDDQVLVQSSLCHQAVTNAHLHSGFLPPPDPFPKLLELLQTYGTEYEVGPADGQVVIRRSDWDVFCCQAIAPRDSDAAQLGWEQSEANRAEPDFWVPGATTIADYMRVKYRRELSLTAFDDLGIAYRPWAAERFDNEKVAKIVSGCLFDLHYLYRPCHRDSIREFYPVGSVVVTDRECSAYEESLHAEVPGSLLILMNGWCSAKRNRTIQFGRPSHFLVLDVFDHRSRCQATLLKIPRESVELFRSMTVCKLDEIVLLAREYFRESIDAEPKISLSSEQLKRLSEPIHANNWKTILPPLFSEPERRDAPFVSSVADRVAAKRRELAARKARRDPE